MLPSWRLTTTAYPLRVQCPLVIAPYAGWVSRQPRELRDVKKYEADPFSWLAGGLCAIGRLSDTLFDLLRCAQMGIPTIACEIAVCGGLGFGATAKANKAEGETI